MTVDAMPRDADVIVVGAGPAGAATSILLAEHGLSVIALDRARFPRDKICGEYLSPEAGRVLDRLGVLKTLDAAGAVPLSGMRITAPDGTTVQGVYRTTGSFRPYREHAIGVSRAVLDTVLADRLRALPVDFRERVRVTDVLRAGTRVTGVRAVAADGGALTLRAPLVIGADGRSSVIAERLHCRHPHRLRRMALTTYVAGIDGCRDFGEIFVDPPDYAILNPLAPDRINLSVVVPLEHAAPWSARLAHFLEARVKQLPHLARRLAGARLVAPVQAMGPLAYTVSRPHEDGVLLVGDAAGFYDPFTGEGIFTALRCAELAADTAVRAIRSGDYSARTLAAYDRARRAAFADKARVTRALQMLIGRRRLANGVARVLARHPRLLDAVLGVVGDYVPPRALPGALLARARRGGG
jgi:menaquinone-9 beta-reductase